MNDVIKVMIVDDEHLVRNLLKKCIDWKAIDMDIVAEASCAEDAFSLVDEHRPDLIFTDICMTHKDGIEFSDTVIKKYPNTKVVVLSGYEDFKYAQRSLRAGIKEYLLKPIDDEVILRTALTMKESILEQRKALNEYDSMKKQISDNLPFLKDRLLNRVIQPEIDMESIDRQMDYVNFRFSFSNFQVAVVEIVFMPQFSGIKEEEKINCQEEILNKMREVFISKENIHFFFDMNYRITILQNCEEVTLERELKEIQDEILNCDYLYYSIGLGGIKKGLENAERSYQEALEALNYRVILGKNTIIKFDNITGVENFSGNAVLELDEKLKVYFLTESENKISEFISNTFSKKELLINTPINKIKEFVINFITTIIDVFKEIEIDVNELNSNNSSIYDELFKLETVPDIIEFLEKTSNKAIQLIGKRKGKKSNKLINDIRDYVMENLGDPELSLSKVAEVFFINSSYLSRLFKKEIGVNFAEFLIKLRIDKSILLLRTTDLKAYEIGEQVGFPDSSYFSACFKRCTGISISEYKKNEN